MASMGFPALAIQPPQPPAQELGQVLAVKNAVQQNEMGQIQLDQARAAQQSQQTLMALYAKNSGDLNQTYADAASSGQVLPDQLLDFRTKSIAAQTQLATLQEKDLTNRKTMTDLAANELEAVKALPVEQRAQGIKDSVGRLLQAGGPNTAQWLIPLAQDLAANPSDENINQKEIGFRGEQWLVENEIKQRQLASTPTAAQAQASNAAKLDKEQTDALIAHRQLLNLPTPEEAEKSRWADLLKTQAQTAEAQATTARQKAETALIGTNPVIAYDPTTNQRVLSTMPQVQAKGFTNPVKATEADINKESSLTRQFNDVQMNISRYKNALLALGNLGDDDLHKTAIAHILSDKSLEAGHALSVLPGASLAAAIQNEKQLAADWDSLSEQERDGVIGYLRSKGSIIAYTKALTDTGRVNEASLKIDMQNLPSPLQGQDSSLKQMDAFQENIDTASRGLTRVPWLPSPQEVRSTIEQEAATKTSRDQAAAQRFQASQSGRTAGQFKPDASSGFMGGVQVGQTTYAGGRKQTVTRVYPDGSYDAQ